MIPNVCGRERNLRAMIGVILIVFGMVVASWILGIAGLLVLLTSVFSYCPINHLLNRNSCTIEQRAKDMINNTVDNSPAI